MRACACVHVHACVRVFARALVRVYFLTLLPSLFFGGGGGLSPCLPVSRQVRVLINLHEHL